MNTDRGVILRQLRDRIKKSQEEVAFEISSSQKLISRHETTGSIGSEWLQRYADYYRVSIDVLAGRAPIPPLTTTPADLPPDAYPLGIPSRLPIVGTVRAGLPIIMHEEIIGWDYADQEETMGGEFFFLRVKGDSMIGDYIPPGALALVRKQETVEPNEIAVVNVNGDEATLKRLRVIGDRAVLVSSNPNYPVMDYPVEEVRVIGRVMLWKVKG